MEHRTVDVLERELRGDDDTSLDPARSSALDLARVRSLGRRRRRLQALAGGAGAAAVAAGLGGVLLATGLVAPGGGGDLAADGTTSRPMSALAQRALAEVPGAEQVSSWQVVIPAPDDLSATEQAMTQRVPDANLGAAPVDVGTRDYSGVTLYRPDAFPDWLYQGSLQAERDSVDDPSQGVPVGSSVSGVVVDAGPIGLACLYPLPEWRDSGDTSRGCSPAMVSGEPGSYSYQWGMGARGFLKPGEPLQLFSTATYVGGDAETVWIGGTDGTDVASVDLVTTDGRTVSATVAPGDLVPGDTMFWGTVDGSLAQAVTYDADGNVLERHVVESCSDPVDCEVR